MDEQEARDAVRATWGIAFDAAWEALGAEVEALEKRIAAVAALVPFRFADVDDPEHTLGDPVLWRSEVVEALSGTAVGGETR